MKTILFFESDSCTKCHQVKPLFADYAPEPDLSPPLRRRIGEGWAREIADAVLAALPELTKEET